MHPSLTKEDKLFFKNKLKQFGEAIIQQRIDLARSAMDNAQEAANGEEKSSAGDKYETSRAMSHLEKDMHARQLAAHLQELKAMQVVNANVICTSVTAGALIVCGKVSFFIAAGLGKQQIEGRAVYFLSPLSPLAKTLRNKKIGDRFVLNEEMEITDLY